MTPSTRAAIAVIAVAAICAYAIFFDGAYFLDAMTVCVVGSWVVMLALVASGEGDALFHPWWPQWTVPALATLFWFWVGASMLWSISRDATWTDFNRTGGYLALLFIGLIAGRYRVARRLALILVMFSIAAASIYGLGCKAFPGSIENLDNLGRIGIPIGYINGMGLLTAMGYLLSVYFMSARDQHYGVRLLAAASSTLILTCLFFTTSRGAIAALAVGFSIYFIAIPARLRSFGCVMLTLVPASLIALWSSGQNVLLDDNVPLDDRITAASQLRIYLLIAVAVSTVGLAVAMAFGRRISFSPIYRKSAGIAILTLIMVSALAGSLWFISSKPSFVNWAEGAYQKFRYEDSTLSGTAHLRELSSGGRWALWQEAYDNLLDNPVLGTGAQSFPLVHFIYRQSGDVFVKQPHGHPFQLLTELGLVGFAIGMAYIAAGQTIGALLLCRLRNRWDRAMAGAILSAIVIYLIDAAYEWDWNIFALTMIWFLFTGILTGWFSSIEYNRRRERKAE